MNRKYYATISIFFIILGLAFGTFVYPDFLNEKINRLNQMAGWNLPEFKEVPFKLGLDLQGGFQLVYEADLSDILEREHGQKMEDLKILIEGRIDQFGVTEPLIQTKGNRLIVELAGVVDPLKAVEMIGETPFLEFKELSDPERDVTSEIEEDVSRYNLEARERAGDILKKIAEGEDFEDLAIEFSEDEESGKAGGDLGRFKRGDMVEDFENAAFSLASGEISEDLIETVFGYHIIKKTEEENEKGEIRASHILIKKKTPRDYIGEWKSTELGGEHLRTARYFVDPVEGTRIELEFTSDGARIFEEITERNIGKPMAIFLDGMSIIDTTGDGRITEEDLYAPVIREKITGGKAVITGNTSVEEAREISSRLRSGALPVQIELISQQNVGPSLGADSLSRSLNAGMWGFLAIVLFMIIFFRLPGLLASLSLILYMIFVLSLFKIFGITLTLSGIAGFILSIGMAIDANILIFARMKEEFNKEKGLRDAIDNGIERAWPSIRDGNLTTLIVAALLFFIGTSFVRGFALTLILGLLVSLFSSMIVTKSFLKSFEKTGFENKNFLWK